jgi:hypothetical protein
VVTASIADYLIAAPLSFLVGVFVGLALASRYRLVRADPPKEDP